jgi:hypothetical protein
VIHLYPRSWAQTLAVHLELIESRESLLSMMDGSWHLGADRLQAAAVYLRLDDRTLYGPAAFHFAVCPETATKEFLATYLRSVPPPPRAKTMLERVRAARHAAEVQRVEEDEAEERRRAETQRRATIEWTRTKAAYDGRIERKAATPRQPGESVEAYIARINARLAALGGTPLSARQSSSMQRGYANSCWHCDWHIIRDGA